MTQTMDTHVRNKVHKGCRSDACLFVLDSGISWDRHLHWDDLGNCFEQLMDVSKPGFISFPCCLVGAFFTAWGCFLWLGHIYRRQSKRSWKLKPKIIWILCADFHQWSQAETQTGSKIKKQNKNLKQSEAWYSLCLFSAEILNLQLAASTQEKKKEIHIQGIQN